MGSGDYMNCNGLLSTFGEDSRQSAETYTNPLRDILPNNSNQSDDERFKLMLGYMQTPVIPSAIPTDGKGKECMWDDVHPDFMPAGQLADLMGIKLSTLSKWCNKGMIRSMRQRGRRCRVHIGDLARLLVTRKEKEGEFEAALRDRIAEARQRKRASHGQ